MIASLLGIKIFATGGIGGVHRDSDKTFDDKSLLDDYYRSRKDPSKASSYAYECKDCTRKRSLRYHHQKSDHHGLSHDDFSMLLEAQNYQCAICRTTNPGGKSGQFVVDYCDKDVRGL